MKYNICAAEKAAKKWLNMRAPGQGCPIYAASAQNPYKYPKLTNQVCKNTTFQLVVKKQLELIPDEELRAKVDFEAGQIFGNEKDIKGSVTAEEVKHIISQVTKEIMQKQKKTEGTPVVLPERMIEKITLDF